jgi:hypothetical protein
MLFDRYYHKSNNIGWNTEFKIKLNHLDLVQGFSYYTKNFKNEFLLPFSDPMDVVAGILYSGCASAFSKTNLIGYRTGAQSRAPVNNVS